MSKDDGEPATGGYAYCKWKLTLGQFNDIYELIRYAKYWRKIDEKLKRSTLEDNEFVPKFKQFTIFNKYIEYFIKV